MELVGIEVFAEKAVRVIIEGDRIAEVECFDGGEGLPYLAPGFFDIQVNGCRGSDYNAEELGSDRIPSIVAELAEAGVTRDLPTLITGPGERIRRNLERIAKAAAGSAELQWAIPGIHLEGPYISAEDGPRGAHDAVFVRDPDWEEFCSWQEASRGMIRLVTLAPERPGAVEFIRRASSCGVRVALGHTTADAVINVFWRTKGAERIILASDAAVMGGQEPGVYRWGGIEVEVFADGHLGLSGTPYLAGAGRLLDWDIPRCISASWCRLAEAVAACTVNPARCLGLPGASAPLAPGSAANLVLFRWKPGELRLQIERTVLAGRTASRPLRPQTPDTETR